MNIQSVATRMPEDLARLLTFQKRGSDVILRPKRPLSQDDLSKLSKVVTEMGGKKTQESRETCFLVIAESHLKPVL